MRSTRAILYWCVFLTLVFGSFYGRSPVLLTESFDSLLDALTISFSSLALVSIKDQRLYTYGLHRLEIFSALANGGAVIIGSVASVGISLLFLDLGIHDIPTLTLILSTAAALLIAPITRGKGGLEQKALVLHSISDFIQYAVGALAGLVILLTRQFYLDPLCSAALALLFVILNFGSLRTSFNVLMERSPVDVEEVENRIRTILPGVHHVHVWTICDHMIIATLHAEEDPKSTLSQLEEKRTEVERLLTSYGINHVTIQFEPTGTHATSSRRELSQE
ncbi:hypothetical protein HS1genome_2270 [Sulfodiicoccus acidiphilus]|uniref:Cation transporter n=1 Tax=Sulfodiicoccus acidiphilus TaxID=1670455 RepID=A0A348B6S9_9CREN|nr:cation diffusion facilitator family transporter [Sulfodiicoccus acidiphilus]BBD73881.1 hypothetical protein HS1genome_2270 [Sulfodiicoccus acidiphilus]GGT96134.1 hypothetical protein GCM10007116_12070 [Sulfodiicoccus acidiphilus]